MTTKPARTPAPRRAFASATAVLALVSWSACSAAHGPSVVQVAGRDVEVVELGSGPATVVFESGLGDGWSPWEATATEVARDAQVFAYSRPGYGRSEATTTPRDAAHIVEDLRALLTARGYAPPYVLVGHSLGGTYMELFAKTHPDEVAALVLVDPRHRDFTTACMDAQLTGCTLPESVLATLPAVQRAEYTDSASAAAQIAAAGTFGDYPVRVLTATSHGVTEALEALWQSMLGELADEAADGEQIVFQGAGHYLQLSHPAEVVEVILSVLPSTGSD